MLDTTAAALPFTGLNMAGLPRTLWRGASFWNSIYDAASPSTIVAPDDASPDSDSSHEESPLELRSTVDLLAMARGGSERAREVLFARCVPPVRRWARGRLPAGARGMLETQDVVQEAVYHVLQRLDSFEARHEGALQAYLRQAVLNRIRDEARRVERRPVAVELEDRHADSAASPLERAIGRDEVERYEAAMQRLRPLHREAIIARIEMQNSYEEIAQAFGRPSANAARSLVVRALYHLYEEMRRGA
jgi:RNA polymerase sigma-70 factor (ECF subfamily)